MKKKILGILFILLASLVTFLSFHVLKEGISNELIFVTILLFPFAWLATVIYCKFFAPHIQKRVAGLTIFSVFFITMLFYLFIQQEIEKKNEYREIGTCTSIGCPGSPYIE